MFSPQFIRAINFTMDPRVEGVLSMDPEDDGNWTSGKKGEGDLRGSKYGISAASYPTIDIASLTLEQAKTIYERDFWQKIRGDDLPPRLSLAVFDFAVNSGPVAAAKCLQYALDFKGDAIDGQIGPATLGAIRGREPDDVLVDFCAARMLRMAQGDPQKFKHNGRGWFRRVVRSVLASVQ